MKTEMSSVRDGSVSEEENYYDEEDDFDLRLDKYRETEKKKK